MNLSRNNFRVYTNRYPGLYSKEYVSMYLRNFSPKNKEISMQNAFVSYGLSTVCDITIAHDTGAKTFYIQKKHIPTDRKKDPFTAYSETMNNLAFYLKKNLQNL